MEITKKESHGIAVTFNVVYKIQTDLNETFDYNSFDILLQSPGKSDHIPVGTVY
jgi:hypothetical protein